MSKVLLDSIIQLFLDYIMSKIANICLQSIYKQKDHEALNCLPE